VHILWPLTCTRKLKQKTKTYLSIWGDKNVNNQDSNIINTWILRRHSLSLEPMIHIKELQQYTWLSAETPDTQLHKKSFSFSKYGCFEDCWTTKLRESIQLVTTDSSRSILLIWEMFKFSNQKFEFHFDCRCSYGTLPSLESLIW